MKTIIDQKITELIELAEMASDKPVYIILSSLSGARHSGQDVDLALKISEYVQDVLLPECLRRRDLYNAEKN